MSVSLEKWTRSARTGGFSPEYIVCTGKAVGNKRNRDVFSENTSPCSSYSQPKMTLCFLRQRLCKGAPRCFGKAQAWSWDIKRGCDGQMGDNEEHLHSWELGIRIQGEQMSGRHTKGWSAGSMAVRATRRGRDKLQISKPNSWPGTGPCLSCTNSRTTLHQSQPKGSSKCFRLAVGNCLQWNWCLLIEAEADFHH